MVRRAWVRRETLTVRLPWRGLAARIGTRVTIDDDGPWRIAGWSLEAMVLELALVRDEGAAPAAAPAAAGRATGGLDAPAGTTIVHLLDLPSFADTPQLLVAAAGTGAGWRRAELSLSLDDGASWAPAGRTALPATLGIAATALAGGSAALFDRAHGVEVMLANAGMTLAGADEAMLLAGANLALLGDELIQFGVAEQIGPSRFRLSILLRGRRGSEWAMAEHAVGERFVLLDEATLQPLAVPLTMLGATARIGAIGPGDAGVTVAAATVVIGRALRPPAPVGLAATRLGDGTVRFAWTRRSRAGWAWLDGADAPLGEDGERYRLAIALAGGGGRTIETGAPAFDYTPAQQAADGAATPATLTATLAQLGTRAASLPAAVGSWTI